MGEIPVVAVWAQEPSPASCSPAGAALPDNIPAADMVCLAVPHAASLPLNIMDSFRQHPLPCFSSFFDEYLLESRLKAVCREKIDHILLVQGTLVNLFGLGVLLTGESGTGKTACSVRLAGKGHAWIADDVVVIERKADGSLSGRGHPRIAHLIEVRGEGAVPAETILGLRSILAESSVDLIVSFVQSPMPGSGRQTVRSILDTELPLLTLPLPADAACIDALIESAAKSLAHHGRNE